MMTIFYKGGPLDGKIEAIQKDHETGNYPDVRDFPFSPHSLVMETDQLPKAVFKILTYRYRRDNLQADVFYYEGEVSTDGSVYPT